MKNKPLLIIPVETRVRELDAKLLLAIIALKQGFDVVLGALWEMKYLMDLLDRGIYLDKSIAKTKYKWFQKCRENGFTIAALDEEGLVYFDAETYRQLRIFPESMEKISCFFAWGQDQAEVMAPLIGSMQSKVKISGNPRFDLLRPELRGFYQKDVESLRNKYGRILLINTSFSFANSSNDPEALLQTFSQYPIAEERPGFFQDWMAAQHRVMESFKEMLPLLRKRFPEHTILIRPHPSESLECWQELTRSMDRAHVVREGNVVPWILASDVLVHWNCTTAIEATLMGIPAISYRKERSDLYEQPLPNGISFHAFDPDELFAMIELAIKKKLDADPADLAKREKLFDHHLASLQGPLAAEKMIDELLFLSENIERKRSLPEYGLQLTKKIWRSLLDRIDSSRHVRDEYIAAKFPDTGIEEIRVIFSRLAVCLKFNPEINSR